MPFKTTSQLQFQKHGLNHRRRQAGLANEFVNRRWREAEQLKRILPFLIARVGGHGRRVERGCPLPEKRSEEHTSELQSLMRISYAVFCLKKNNSKKTHTMKKHESDK